MNVTLVQTQLFWEDRDKNLAHFGKLLDSVSSETSLIILPEMFSTGFSMNPRKIAETMGGETLQWMKYQARKKNCVLTGSVAVNENGNNFNRLFWVRADGSFDYYDKRHLFRMAKEEQHYKAGTRKIFPEIGPWKCCPLVCYDLRFPVWSRNKFTNTVGHPSEGAWEYDVLIFVANWPETRSYVWKQLLIARAIENQCYVIGLNRIGEDGNGYSHSGDSAVINPKGEVISTIKAHEEVLETIELNLDSLREFRRLFPVGLDADSFSL